MDKDGLDNRSLLSSSNTMSRWCNSGSLSRKAIRASAASSSNTHALCLEGAQAHKTYPSGLSLFLPLSTCTYQRGKMFLFRIGITLSAKLFCVASRRDSLVSRLGALNKPYIWVGTQTRLYLLHGCVFSSNLMQSTSRVSPNLGSVT